MLPSTRNLLNYNFVYDSFDGPWHHCNQIAFSAQLVELILAPAKHHTILIDAARVVEASRDLFEVLNPRWGVDEVRVSLFERAASVGSIVSEGKWTEK